jgi:hypothetical protein
MMPLMDIDLVDRLPGLLLPALLLFRPIFFNVRFNDIFRKTPVRISDALSHRIGEKVKIP